MGSLLRRRTHRPGLRLSVPSRQVRRRIAATMPVDCLSYGGSRLDIDRLTPGKATHVTVLFPFLGGTRHLNHWHQNSPGADGPRVLRLLMMRRRRAPDCRASWMAPRTEAQRRAGPGGPASESLGEGDSEFASSRQPRHSLHEGPRVPTLTARRKVHQRASFQTEVHQVTPGPTDVL